MHMVATPNRKMQRVLQLSMGLTFAYVVATFIFGLRAHSLALLSEVGGGATRMPPAQGAWLNPATGALILDDVTLVYSYVDGDALTTRLSDIRALLHGLGRALNQGEVVVEVNESFYKIRDFDI